MLNTDINKDNHKPNVILITLDDFSYELFMENIDILPNLKALKAKSLFFENAFAIGPTTYFAFPGIIGGIYPYHFGIGLDENVSTIGTVLKNRGYNTALINMANGWLTPLHGYGRHMDYQNHCFDLPYADSDRKLQDTFVGTEPRNLVVRASQLLLIRKFLHMQGWEWAVKLGEYVIAVYEFLKAYLMHSKQNFQEKRRLFHEFQNTIFEFIDQRFEKPQFLWIHTVINHVPYFPAEDDQKFTSEEINYLNYRCLSNLVNHKICGRIRDLYIESLRRTDQFVGEVLEALKKKDLIDNSIIIITADHGEEFMEEEFHGHLPTSSSDRLLHVPLIFHWNKLTNRTINIPVSTIDIVPTLCDLLNIQIPDSSKGMSLKEVMIHEPEDSEEVRKFWQRPLFSEAWEITGLLDRRPGYQSDKMIFTIRKGQYKLKVVRQQRMGNTISEKLELINWINNERLDVKNNKLIVEELLYYLYKHLYKEGVFSSNLHENSEKQRIKRTLTRLRGKI